MCVCVGGGGQYRLLLFGAICQIQTYKYSPLKIRHLSYIAISHKPYLNPILFSCGKMSSRASRPLGLLCFGLFFRFAKHYKFHTLAYSAALASFRGI